ncbi:membrane-spanning 4-domains subfamily A member 5-like isoform X1 [Clarias gariepinus]|uniref:membrane-spanning 4-domains subfamily A member 5-like isoform X1 n=1 Tax=Clarias gariepinus TaxID=13013 RepID=UPI00234CEF96|nr:membrane-spanning 4-domains subfamily A member 5-like isoform X1 [Clarias gariepinus]
MASTTIPLTNVQSGYTIVTQVIPTSTEQNTPETPSPLRKFLKGEPKALGAVQITNGFWMFFLGLVSNTLPIFSLYNFIFWVSLLHISAGALTVSGSKNLQPCVVKGAMVLNILSAICTVISIVMLSLDLVMQLNCYRCSNYSNSPSGVIGILLFFSLLQLAISISTSAFARKATCSNKPNLSVINMVANPERCVALDNSFPAHQAHPLNILNMVPNLEGYVPVDNTFPTHHVHPGISTSTTVPMNSLPVESPPAYSETYN